MVTEQLIVKSGYKETQVGTIPEDWDLDEIQNHSSITTGAKNTQDKIKNGKFPFFVRSQKIEKINTYSFNGEAVLTAGDGVGTGKIFHYINGKFDFHQRVYKISNFDDCLDGYFFYIYFSNYFLTRIMSMNAKSSVDSVRKHMISEMLIPLPEKNEQIIISTAMKNIMALIETFDKIIEKKKNIKQGTMQELLTGKKRLEGFSEEWINQKLGDVTRDIRDGTHQTPIYVKNGIPFYSVESITNDNFTDVKFISEQEHLMLTKSFKIEKGDILMTRIGSIGDCKLIDWDVNASFYVSLALLKLNEKISPEFLYHYSKSNLFKKELEIRSLLWAVPKKINLGSISETPLCVPASKKEQKEIAKILSDMDSEIEQLETKREKYIMIKNTMMQKLLTGEIRLA